MGQLADWIGELTHPAFIMWGEQDSLIPISVGQRFYREIAHNEFISFSGLVNVPQEEDPRVTVDAAKRFCIANKCNSFR